MWQNAVFILIALGALCVIGYFAQEFFLAGDIHILIRIAVGAVSAGVLMLLFSVLRERMKKARSDDFEEVER